jgi:hypothetical protein
VEHVVFPSLVLDSCGHYDRIAVGGMSFTLTMLRGVYHVYLPYLFSQALTFKNINGESIPDSLELSLIVDCLQMLGIWLVILEISVSHY